MCVYIDDVAEGKINKGGKKWSGTADRNRKTFVNGNNKGSCCGLGLRPTCIIPFLQSHSAALPRHTRS